MKKPSNNAREIFKELISIANVRRIKASMNPIRYDLITGLKKIFSALIDLFLLIGGLVFLAICILLFPIMLPLIRRIRNKSYEAQMKEIERVRKGFEPVSRLDRGNSCE